MVENTVSEPLPTKLRNSECEIWWGALSLSLSLYRCLAVSLSLSLCLSLSVSLSSLSLPFMASALRGIAKLRPRRAWIENVPEMSHSRPNESGLSWMCAEFEKMGYITTDLELDSADLLPGHRRRRQLSSPPPLHAEKIFAGAEEFRSIFKPKLSLVASFSSCQHSLCEMRLFVVCALAESGRTRAD